MIKDVKAFESSVITAQHHHHRRQFNAAVGILSGTAANNNTVWAYAPGTPLATLDAQMGALQFKFPWGGGLGINPTGGLGLANNTAVTTNPQSVGLRIISSRFWIRLISTRLFLRVMASRSQKTWT